MDFALIPRKVHRKTLSLLHVPHTLPSMETVYRSILVRDLRTLGIEDVFYPLGAAANHGLLYVLVRCFCELEVRNVIELGAGQSTILINMLCQRLEKHTNVLTIESSEQWAEYVRPKITHSLHVHKLTAKKMCGKHIMYYEPSYLPQSELFDLIIVDGPFAGSNAAAFNRLGALDIVKNNLSESFVIVIDDAERYGEQALVAQVRKYLSSRKVPFSESKVTAIKCQHLFCAGAFQKAAFF